MEKALASLPPGGALSVLATDPMAKVDIPLHCKQHGHACTLAENGEVMHFAIVKAG
jgi:tRNA 2-thiouridine synthesizing protein A